jgi:hypothetical protein
MGIHYNTQPDPATDINYNDNVKAIYGTGGDAEIYHNGTDLIIDPKAVGAGVLNLQGTLAISDATEGNTFRLERKTAHDSVTLTGATTDTTTISVPSGARLVAVALNVDTAVVNDGDNTWAAAFVTGSTTAVVAAGAAAAQNTKVTKMLPDEITSGVAQIRFTPQGADFTAGVIEVVVVFEVLVPMANA